MISFLKKLFKIKFYTLLKKWFFLIVGFFFKYFKKYIYIDSHKFKFFNLSLYEYGAFSFGVYEYHERKLIKEFLSPDSIVLELGGCIGVVSTTINKILLSPEKHIVLEPNPEMVDLLKFNKKINNGKFNIENTIISNKSTVFINIYSNFTSSSIYNYNKNYPLKKKKSIEVTTTTIEKLQQKYSLLFDVLIMDIEGSELEIIKTQNLSQFKLIILEYHTFIYGSEGKLEYSKILKENNFKLTKFSGHTECWTRQK